MSENRTKRRKKTEDTIEATTKTALLLEPFCGGSHGQLVELLEPFCLVCSLPAKKWHWRVLVSAVQFAEAIPFPLPKQIRCLFATSMLNLAELVALRPDLQRLRKIVYFHENQFIYPKRNIKKYFGESRLVYFIYALPTRSSSRSIRDAFKFSAINY